MRTIWREHNRRTFEDVSKTVHQLTDCFAAVNVLRLWVSQLTILF